jgi:hypothetical protein
MEDIKVICIECHLEFLLKDGFRDTGGKILCPRCFATIDFLFVGGKDPWKKVISCYPKV